MAATPNCNGDRAMFDGNFSTALPTFNGSTNCITGNPSAGSWVSDIQSSLDICNSQNISVDGIYGPATAQAVRNVQAAHKIPVDGIYGPMTRNVMLWAAFNDIGKHICVPYSSLHF
jgi:peptidoglycan hydrolase-like protein with peptidoglycan-binding domain